MIQAHEIKIGNRFIRELHNSHGLEYDHDFILTEEWMGKLFGDNTSIALQDLFPIPLSPEILEKLNFKIVNHILGYSFYSLERKSGSYTPPIDIFENKTLYYGHHVAHCQYLHELQNLYYALTKTELNYQP